ncbi:MAG: hypothetical protein Q8O92_15070 [Candidatus Latescibacter sp.]|nr:hypothetical protein [Candidatus Latescibacter sp.]
MRIITRLIAAVFLAVILAGIPAAVQARVMMTGMINPSNGFSFDIIETATFTVDDWISSRNVWWLTIDNTSAGPSDTLSITFAEINIHIGSTRYPDIIGTGASPAKIYLIGSGSRYFRQNNPLRTNEKMVVDNTMVSGGGNYVSGKWSTAFKDEVVRIGFLPEGTYTMEFSLHGNYSDGRSFDNDVDRISATIQIKNPRPPELVSPVHMTEDAVSVPRFTWQAPQISDLSQLGKAIRTFYTLTVWKMFSENGAFLTQFEAIRRIPIWKLTDLTVPSADFDPGTSREELVSGRRYCWQVQAFDSMGRVIGSTNEGKSDVWQFTVRFVPLTVNQPILFNPLRFSWTAAQAGGSTILYNVSIADNQGFARAYISRGQTLTSFNYPSDAPALTPGKPCYIRIQVTDDKGIPIGVPTQETVTIPLSELVLLSPDDNFSSSTLTPAFRWRGDAKNYVVTVSQEGTRWSYASQKTQETSWTYDGEELKRGQTYSWKVTPTDDNGNLLGTGSEARRFTIPVEGQITLVSPVNTRIDTIFPTFTWNAPSTGGEGITYILTIYTETGTVAHTASVTGTAYQYPQTGTMLSYAAKYLWDVRAQRNGADLGTKSAQASFITPFVTPAAGAEVSLDDVGAAIKLLAADFPQIAALKNKTVTEMKDKNGPVTPAQLRDLLDKFKIKSVTIK